MKRRPAYHPLIIAGAVFILLTGARAQAAGDDEKDLVIHSDVRLVLLDVSVKDRDGSLVSGLSKDNFRVDENGKDQNVTVFASKDVPVTVGLLVDNSRSMMPKREEVLSAATSFIIDSNPKDEIFVLNFNETVRRGLPSGVLFSDDVKQLDAALARGKPAGRTALYDAVMEGLEQLGQGKRDKKTLIIISDGGDNISKHTRREMLDKVESSLATIYTIGLFNAGDKDQDPGILRKLAKMTGGQAYFPESADGMTDVCRGIAKDIRTRYTLGYPPQDTGGMQRRVHVHVSSPGKSGLIARTRPSYRYDQTASQ